VSSGFRATVAASIKTHTVQKKLVQRGVLQGVFAIHESEESVDFLWQQWFERKRVEELLGSHELWMVVALK